MSTLCLFSTKKWGKRKWSRLEILLLDLLFYHSQLSLCQKIKCARKKKKHLIYMNTVHACKHKWTLKHLTSAQRETDTTHFTGGHLRVFLPE